MLPAEIGRMVAPYIILLIGIIVGIQYLRKRKKEKTEESITSDNTDKTEITEC